MPFERSAEAKVVSAAALNVPTNCFIELWNARQTSFIYWTTSLVLAGGDVGLSLYANPTNQG